MRGRSFYISLFLFGGFFFTGCVREEIAADLNPPPAVQFTMRSADTALVEQGIDAVPEGDYIYLSWLPSDAGDLAGYRLYRQVDSLGSPSPEQIVDQEATEYTDRSSILAPNAITGFSQGFRYRVTAYDESGNESGFSEEAYYRLMDKTVLSQPIIQGNNLILSWNYMQYDPLDFSYYVVRLSQSNGGEWGPFWVYQHELPSPTEVIYSEPLPSGTYRFQVDVVGAPESIPSGSEAALTFEIP